MRLNYHGIGKSILTDWKYKDISKVNEEIKNTVRRASTKRSITCFNNTHNEFVVTPIIKTNGSIAFICQ